jgi:nitrous oxidase accessory protein NosD
VGPGTVRNFIIGVRVADAPGAQVVAVTATGNSDDGIVVRNSPGAQVVNNATPGNDFGIFVFDCAGCRVASNRVERSGQEGIFVGGAPRAPASSSTPPPATARPGSSSG